MSAEGSLLAGRVAELAGALATLADHTDAVATVATVIADSMLAGHKLMVAGNGGSAAEAQHLTGELLGRLDPARERGPLPAFALHVDSSAMTAIGNDYGYDQVFARQVDALGREGDVLLVLSTSGASPNLVEAVAVANARGVVTVGLLGAGPRPLHELCTHVIAVDARGVQVVQECHLVLVHVLAAEIEDRLAASDAR